MTFWMKKFIYKYLMESLPLTQINHVGCSIFHFELCKEHYQFTSDYSLFIIVYCFTLNKFLYKCYTNVLLTIKFDLHN